MNLTIIIPVKDDMRIADCVKSIDEEVEVLIVLNDPSEGVKQLVNELDASIYEISEANISKALNLGIEKAKYANVLLMDSDCIFEKNTIRKLFDGLSKSKISKGKVIFKRKDIVSDTVAKVREFSTSDFLNAFSPPLAFNKDIIKDIGYYFSPVLKWEEDLDFHYRVKEKRINIHWDQSAVIYHPELTLYNDLKNAYNYGSGHKAGIEMGIYKKTEKNKLSDLERLRYKRIKKIQLEYIKRTKGRLAKLYYLVWNYVYKLGTK